jgi:hypothetical protein
MIKMQLVFKVKIFFSIPDINMLKLLSGKVRLSPYFAYSNLKTQRTDRLNLIVKFIPEHNLMGAIAVTT